MDQGYRINPFASFQVGRGFANWFTIYDRTLIDFGWEKDVVVICCIGWNIASIYFLGDLIWKRVFSFHDWTGWHAVSYLMLSMYGIITLEGWLKRIVLPYKIFIRINKVVQLSLYNSRVDSHDLVAFLLQTRHSYDIISLGATCNIRLSEKEIELEILI